MYYFWKTVASLALIALSFPAASILARFVRSHGERYLLSPDRVDLASKTVKSLLYLLVAVVIGGVWQVGFDSLSIYLASSFTVLGVSFFTQWSLLSSITASLILFFYFPIRVGTRIRIVDGDNTNEGKVVEIGLFSVQIKLDNGNIVTYANNQVIQKPVMRVNHTQPTTAAPEPQPIAEEPKV
ncbi:MAG: mechanosensitive ion channel domain-containing protein [Puniceicoccales bacterium]